MSLKLTSLSDPAKFVTIELPASIEQDFQVQVKELPVIGTSNPIAFRRHRKSSLRLSKCYVEGSSAQGVIDTLKSFTLIDEKTLTSPTLKLEFGKFSMDRCILVELKVSAEWFPSGIVTKAFLDLTLMADPEPKKPLKEDLSKLTAKEKKDKLEKLQEAVKAGKFKELPKDYELRLDDATGKVTAIAPGNLEVKAIGTIEARGAKMNNPIEDFFNDIFRALEHTRATSNLVGSSFTGLGIVLDNSDPENNLAVKVRYSNGQESDWIPYCAPFFGFYPDVPPIGSTVLISHIDGDPARPIYTGVLVNNLNPNQGTVGVHTIKVGDTKVVFGDNNVAIKDKQVVTIGGKDTRNDTINLKGW